MFVGSCNDFYGPPIIAARNTEIYFLRFPLVEKKDMTGSLLAFAINGLIFSYVAMFLRLPTGRILVLEGSPDDPKRAQHLFFPDIPCLHAAELSTGSVESAFESEKHKKYAKLYLQCRKEQAAFTLQKSIRPRFVLHLVDVAPCKLRE